MTPEELEAFREQADYGGLNRSDSLELVAECVRLRVDLRYVLSWMDHGLLAEFGRDADGVRILRECKEGRP